MRTRFRLITVLILASAGCTATREEAERPLAATGPDSGSVQTTVAQTTEPAPAPVIPIPDTGGERLNQLQKALPTPAVEGRAAQRSLETAMRRARPMAEEVVVTGSRIRAPQGYTLSVPPMTPPIPRDRFQHFDENRFILAAKHPVSTFSIDVDTASYATARRWLERGRLPPHDSVRVEEFINYFDYAYETPSSTAQPFAVTTEIGQSPWHDDRHLLLVALKAYERDPSTLPAANLVFLIDTSGSMRSPDKLDLVKASLKMLARNLDHEDRISIVVYAGAAGVVLEPTPGDDTGAIHRALDGLHAGGSTNGGAGIQLAYSLADEAFIDGGINRVILATDGDFNVGVTSQHDLKEIVEQKRKSGVSLTVLGFGQGNYNDALMQEIAQIGDGNAAYIDTINEARKVLVDEMSSTFETVARDVKIQIEFNPARVAEYRLIGYESRALEREDFNNDKVDAGDIGAGHAVTALYELTMAGSEARAIDPLRYQASDTPVQEGRSDELAYVKLRYKLPSSDQSTLVTEPIRASRIPTEFTAASPSFRFAAAVAGYAQLLKGGTYTSDLSYADVIALARGVQLADDDGYRAEFINLVKTADALGGERLTQR